MSNKTRLQTNNTNLQALIDKANALPDAGSGGGGSVETCTVTVSGGIGYIRSIVGTNRAGAFGYTLATGGIPATFEVVKNCSMVVTLSSPRYYVNLNSDAITYLIEENATCFYLNVIGDGSISIA